MYFTTVGREIYSGYELPLWYNSDEKFDQSWDYKNRYRIILIKEGNGILRINKELTVIITVPMVCCLNNNDILEIIDAKDISAASVYFHPNVINNKFMLEMDSITLEGMSETDSQDIWSLKPFIKRAINQYGIFSIDMMIAQHFWFLLKTLGDELNGQYDDSWPCRSRTYLLELLFIASRAFNNTKTFLEAASTNTSRDIDAILKYLYINYGEKITVKELTKLFHINRTTLNDKFIKSTGVPVITYLNDFRIKMACAMLRSTTLSINEIYNRVGFKDDAHFSRTFRKYVQCTPTEYRRVNCNM